MKVCSKCGVEKEADRFSVWKNGYISKTCKNCLSIRSSEKKKAYKQLLFEHYGFMCQCCMTIFPLEFLNIDHINNDGRVQRQEKQSRNGGSIYAVGMANITAGIFPKDLQTLCWNCNCAKGLFGKCPYEGRPHYIATQNLKIPQKILSTF